MTTRSMAVDPTPLAPKDKRKNLRMAVPVAMVWLVLAAIVQLFLTMVLVRGLPRRVHFAIMSGSDHPNKSFHPPEVFDVAWIIIAVCTVVLVLAYFGNKKGKPEAIDAAVIVTMGLTLFVAAESASLLFQVGFAREAPAFTDEQSLVILVATLGMPIISVLTIYVVTKIRAAHLTWAAGAV